LKQKRKDAKAPKPEPVSIIRRYPKALKVLLAALGTLLALFLGELLLLIIGYPTVYYNTVHPPYVSFKEKSIEFEDVVKTNNMGLRNATIPFKKPAGTRRVFLLGDSYTEGAGVAFDKTFCRVLGQKFEKHEPSVEFINGGRAGSGPVIYKRILCEIGMKYSPDAVLVFVFANDIFNSPSYYEPRGCEEMPEGSKNLMWRIFPRAGVLFQWSGLYWADKRSKRTTDFVRTVSKEAEALGISSERISAWRNAIPRDLVEASNRGEFSYYILSSGLIKPDYWAHAMEVSTPEAQQRWESIAKVLYEIKRICILNNMDFGILFIPAPFQFDPGYGLHNGRNVMRDAGYTVREAWLTGETEIQRRYARFSEQNQVPFLDLTPEFRGRTQAGQRLVYQLDGHCNDAGHAAIAEAVEAWVKEKRVFRFLQ
jgi:lysophospholipase L1-like esterase